MMFITILIVGLLFFYFVNNENRTTKSSTIEKSTPVQIKKPVQKPIVTEPINRHQISLHNVDSIISVRPTKISTNPESRFSLIEGEYRTFQNYYIHGVQYTFGFPKPECWDKRVWVGRDNEEIERISYREAMQRINSKSIGYSNTSFLNSYL